MQPLAVDAALLRTVLQTEVRLTLGRELMVRVAAVGADGRGVLSLAGMLLEAELPGDVHAGQELRLQVRELTPDKVVLAIHDESQQSPLVPVEAPRVPLPGGGALQVTERHAGGRTGAEPGGGAHTLSLRYDAPRLGPIDLQFTLTDGALGLTVTVAPGAHEAADGSSGRLESALAAATERTSRVTVVPRREPVEVFA